MRLRAQTARRTTGMVLDEERILNLPVEDYPDNLVETWTGELQTVRSRVRGDDPPLFPVQAEFCEALSRAPDRRGVVASVSVGDGKTLMSLLAGTVLDAKKVLILLPASLRKQNLEDQARWKPIYKVHPNITLCSYEKLSHPNHAFILDEIGADLVIMDEAHSIASSNSTRTKRIFNYFKSRPKTRAIVMSGTLTSKGLNDYAHLVELALRQGSPLPTSFAIRERWCAVLDPFGEFTDNDWSQIRWLVGEAVGGMRARKRAAQLAFQKRFKSAPGIVVSSSENRVNASLVYASWTPETAPEIETALDSLRRTWTLPNGDEIADALEYSRAQKQISLGFYYVWVWPDGEPDFPWLETRCAWMATVRNIVAFGRPGMDSPALVARAAEQRRLSVNVLSVWDEWEAHRHKDPPPTETRWLSDAPLREAVEWTKEQPPLILWYRSRAVASKLEELGIRVFTPGSAPPSSAETCALSISSYGQGIDGLQYLFSNQLVLEPASSGRSWEQMVGRTHRTGATADVVNVHFYAALAFQSAMIKAKTEAKYIERTTGTRQKLVYGSFGDSSDQDLLL